jgi:hypothetical protein
MTDVHRDTWQEKYLARARAVVPPGSIGEQLLPYVLGAAGTVRMDQMEEIDALCRRILPPALAAIDFQVPRPVRSWAELSALGDLDGWLAEVDDAVRRVNELWVPAFGVEMALELWFASKTKGGAATHLLRIAGFPEGFYPYLRMDAEDVGPIEQLAERMGIGADALSHLVNCHGDEVGYRPHTLRFEPRNRRRR